MFYMFYYLFLFCLIFQIIFCSTAASCNILQSLPCYITVLFFHALFHPHSYTLKPSHVCIILFSISSWLSRAIETAWLVLDELDLLWLPIIKTWRLNERYTMLLI